MRRIIKRLLDTSILWKFTFIYFILIIVPLAVFQVTGYNRSVASIREQNFNILAQTVSQVKQNVLYMTKNCEYVSDFLRFDNQVQGFLGNEFDPMVYYDYEIEPKLSKLSQVGSQHFDLFFYTSNASIPEMDRVVYNISRIEGKEEYKKLVNNKETNSIWGVIKKRDYFYGLQDHVNETSMVLPIYTKIRSLTINNSILGILEIDLPLEEITKTFSTVKIGTNGYIAVMDSKGTIIYNGGTEVLEKYIDHKQLGQNSGVTDFQISKEKYNVVYDTVDGTDLKILAVVNENEILDQLSTYKASVWTILVLGVLFAFLVTYIVTRFLFKRIKVLLKMMKRVENGDFDSRVTETRNDEIGELTNGFNHMTEKLEQILVELVEKETAQWEAELKALQAQINPHFLYNTLESLKMECEMNRQYELSDALTSLGALFRYNINSDSRCVTLKQEIEHVRNYVSVMKIRYSDRIELKIDLPVAFMGIKVPKVLLQPLVENCFSHSFNSSANKFIIEISAVMNNKIISINITDNGAGIDGEKLKAINNSLQNNTLIVGAKNNGVGLTNVNRRIRMEFGGTYGIRLESGMNQGTNVILTLPVSEDALLIETGGLLDV
ncbi:MAG: putative sensor with domain [Eubacterium sp.]|nr:putative sensor with domain [Eubacterium sp.]